MIILFILTSNCKIASIVKDVIYMTYEETQKIKHLREVTSVMVEEP